MSAEYDQLLQQIDSPEALQRLTPDQLPRLAAEIRGFIVQKVAVSGGHLGSNLGAVELTIALHRTFSCPNDVILWDTGHQAYVHKILTGRLEQFSTLRQAGGLSGYPSRSESDSDWIENSHASTVLSYAHGIAAGFSAGGHDARRVVAVIGDGALTGGMAFEGLNNLGHAHSRVTVVLNDNGRSYAPTVSRLSESVSRLRGDPRYMAARSLVERGLKRLPKFSGVATTGIKSMRAALREAVEPFAFFEALGVRYIGPIDGHDIEGMESAFRDAAEFDGPIVVHVLTEKGRGYAPAEDDDEKHLHDVKVFDPETGPCTSSANDDYTAAFSQALCQLGELNNNVHAITAAMPGSTGLLDFAARFPGRVHDVGIAEQHAVTCAAGMAMAGLRPIVAVYATFFTRAIDQALYDVCMHNLPVIFALDRAGITGPDGASHHGMFDIALTQRIPNLTIMAPSSAQELGIMLNDACELGTPVLLRYPRGKAQNAAFENTGSQLHARKIAGAERGGKPTVCILALGNCVAPSEVAAKHLYANGIGTSLWDIRIVKPLDSAMLREALGHDIVVTIEDGVLSGGVGETIGARLAEMAMTFNGAMPKLLNLGLPNAFIAHASPDALHEKFALDAPGIIKSVLSIMSNVVDENVSPVSPGS